MKSGGYGAGHGFEVYDISGEKATWISTSKIDGRLYYAADDSWGIYINGNYAFYPVRMRECLYMIFLTYQILKEWVQLRCALLMGRINTHIMK